MAQEEHGGANGQGNQTGQERPLLSHESVGNGAYGSCENVLAVFGCFRFAGGGRRNAHEGLSEEERHRLPTVSTSMLALWKKVKISNGHGNEVGMTNIVPGQYWHDFQG